MRTFHLIAWFLALAWGLVAATGRAETYQLTTGTTITGEMLPTSANDAGVQVKVGDGKYERVPWGNFSQEDLKKLKENPKLEPFVDPFIEITAEERIKKTEVPIKQPLRLERPARQSFFGALFSSGLGLCLALVLYAATIYAGFEVAVFRGHPVALVAGLSAIPFLGVLAPIIFGAMPTRMQPVAQTWETAPAAAPGQAAAAAGADVVNPMQGETAAPTGGLKLHSEPQEAKPALPPTTTFQRGQFTFNRRFIETKFAGFFGVVRRDAERDMVLLVKSARGEYTGDRITRITGNDLHLQVHQGQASQEVMIPFQDIKEIQLKHKDAP